MEKKNSYEEKAIEKFCEVIIERISEINKDWEKPWFSASACKYPVNLSGREYNGMNALMLSFVASKENYNLPVWATFDRITSLNYERNKQGCKTRIKDEEGNNLPSVCVNKGEKSFPVFITLFSVKHKETKEKISYDDYKNLSDAEKENYNIHPYMQVYNVFNIDQTNIKESRPELYNKLEERYNPKVVKEMKKEIFAPLDYMIKNDAWLCKIKEIQGDDAYYTISKDEIVVPKREQFKDAESFSSNTFHEMAHSTGAESRLNRLKPASFGSKEYAREELVAELTAAVVACRYGMMKHVKDDSAVYLKCWLERLKESPEFLKTVLFDVKRATSMITQEIEKVKSILEDKEKVA